MRKYPALIIAALLIAAGAAPAMAQEAACAAPTAPSVPDGAASTMEQMLAGKKQIDAFMAASDAYQDCEIKAVEAQRAAAKAAKTKFDEGAAKQVQVRISANQKQKEDLAAGWSAAIKAYKAAHPG